MNTTRRAFYIAAVLCSVLGLYALAAHLDAHDAAMAEQARQAFCERHPSRCNPQLHHHR